MNNTSLEPELNSLKSKLVIEIENDSKQVEVLKRKIEKNQSLLNAVRSRLSAALPSGITSGYGAKSEMIWKSIGELKMQFTQDDLEAVIRRISPDTEINRNRIRASLWTLCTKYKKIKVFRKGNSREPAIYEKITPGLVPAPPANANGNDAHASIHRYPRTETDDAQVGNQILTAAQFEERIRRKNAHVRQIAHEFKVSDETILGLLHPKSRVYLAKRGWLKLRP
jgi:hypothetical protein